MKANAPEKIYIDDPTGEFDDHWSLFPNNGSIEYTRTDAFIEKAQLFFIDKLKEIPIGNGKMKIKAECSLDEFIEQFKKYVEE